MLGAVQQRLCAPVQLRLLCQEAQRGLLRVLGRVARVGKHRLAWSRKPRPRESRQRGQSEPGTGTRSAAQRACRAHRPLPRRSSTAAPLRSAGPRSARSACRGNSRSAPRTSPHAGSAAPAAPRRGRPAPWRRRRCGPRCCAQSRPGRGQETCPTRCGCCGRAEGGSGSRSAQGVGFAGGGGALAVQALPSVIVHNARPAAARRCSCGIPRAPPAAGFGLFRGNADLSILGVASRMMCRHSSGVKKLR